MTPLRSSGEDHGLDYGLEYGLNSRLINYGSKPGLGLGAVLGLGTTQRTHSMHLVGWRGGGGLDEKLNFLACPVRIRNHTFPLKFPDTGWYRIGFP